MMMMSLKLKGIKKNINIRLIGGQNHDIYTVTNGRKTKIIDFKSKINSYAIDSKTKKLLTDDYTTNLYDFRKPKYNAFSALPTIGFNPDDGIKIGIITNYAINHFNQIHILGNTHLKLIIILPQRGLNYYTAFMCLKH
jgi:hypothetical protein